MYYILLIATSMSLPCSNTRQQKFELVVTKGSTLITHFKWLEDGEKKPVWYTYHFKDLKKVKIVWQAGYFQQQHWTKRVARCYSWPSLEITTPVVINTVHWVLLFRHYCIWRICWHWLSPWSSYVYFTHWWTPLKD